MFVLSEKTANIIKIVLALAAITIVSRILYLNQLSISSLFKIYFMIAGVFFIYTQFKRYNMVEFISTVGVISGIFFLLSFNSQLIVFSSFILIITSCFGFMTTRFRPNKNTISFVYLTLIFALLYGIAPFLSVLAITVILLMFLFRSKDSSIDSLIITLLIPTVFYLFLLDLAKQGLDIQANITTLRIVSLATMIFISTFFMSKQFHQRTSCSYSVFYIAHILFALSINTMASIIIGLLMIFILPFIYSSKANRFSIFNMAMLPPSPVFILKLSLLGITLNMGYITDYVIILASYTIVLFNTFRYFYIVELENKAKFAVSEKVLGTVSFLVILVCLIYLNTIKNIVGSALANIAG